MLFERLKDVREDKELIQEDIASLLKVKQQTYSIWENGDKIIPLKHLNTLSNYYHLSMDYLVGITDDKSYKANDTILDMKIIGNKLKVVRKSLKLTQEQLAKELNTSHSTLSAYESGKTMILTAFAYQICINHKISLDWLCKK